MYHYSGLSPKHTKDAILDMKRPFIDELIFSAEFYSVCGHISASLNRAISAVHGDYSWLPETPATDAFLAGIKSDGVESGIKTIMTMLNHQAPGVSDAINVLRVHSSELREGADK